MSGVWSTTVDGAFKGGKWGMYAGAAAGILTGFTVIEPLVAFDTFFLGPFGAAATLGALGALGGIVIGAAVGAAGGALYGAVKSAFAPSSAQDRQHYEAMGKEPRTKELSHSEAREQTLNLASEPSTAFQERLRESRLRDDPNHYRGL